MGLLSGLGGKHMSSWRATGGRGESTYVHVVGGTWTTILDFPVLLEAVSLEGD